VRNDRVNEIIRTFADGEFIIWHDFNTRFLCPDGTLSEKVMPDLLHPLEPGYRIWREEIEPLMEKIAFGFRKARPVWVKGASSEMNAFYGFSASFEAGRDALCRFSAGSIARVWVNGRFAGYGPARSAEGWMRIDEIPIGELVQEGNNVIAFEVSSPRVPSFYLMDREPFLAAEIVSGGCVVAATGSAAGITLLMGGGYEEITYAIKNMIANISGMICDGAKPGCALKVTSGVSTAIFSAYLAMQHSFADSTEGIVEDDIDRTIRNLTRIGHDGMQVTDDLILDIMTHKK
jgi:hypothetical protein